MGAGVGTWGEIMWVWRKAQHLGCLNEEFIFYQLPVRSLVTTEEFMTPWGRMNQGLREADCCLPTSVSERGSEMQWCRAWGLDWSWNPDCSQVAGARFFTLSFLF